MNAPRRGPLDRWHARHGAQFEQHGDSRYVASYRDQNDDQTMTTDVALCDLSLVPRFGFKGGGTLAWLAQHVNLPAAPNLANSLAGAAVLARLSRDEHLVIAAPGANRDFAGELQRHFESEQPAGVYGLPRADSHCLFALAGEAAADVLAKVCAVDMRTQASPCGSVAQTSVARLNAIVIRTHCEPTPLYYLLAESTAAEYFWECLIDATSEFSGRFVGYQALRPLLEPTE